MGLVKMRHPEIEGTAEATAEAVETVWGPLGWVLEDEEPADEPTDTNRG